MRYVKYGLGILPVLLSTSIVCGQLTGIHPTSKVHAAGQLCDTTFLVSEGGDHSIAQNWSHGLPTANAIACIPDIDRTNSIASTMALQVTTDIPPNTIGACCLGSSCVITDAFDCKIQRGFFKPKTVFCSDSVCGTGACCTPEPSCDDSGGAMNEGVCETIGGIYIGGALCDQSDACQTVRLPQGFEIISISASEGGHGLTRINDCGEIVYTTGGGGFLGIPENEIYLYDNGKTTQITSDPLVSNGQADINNRGDIVWTFGVDGFGGGEIHLVKDGVITILGEGQSPRINHFGRVVWNHRVQNCPPFEVPDDFQVIDDLFIYDGTATSLFFSNGLSNQGAFINDHSEVIWTRYDFDCPFTVFWTSEILLSSNGTITSQPGELFQRQSAAINNFGRMAWSGHDTIDSIVELVENGLHAFTEKKSCCPDMNNGRIMSFLFKTSSTPWQVWLDQDGSRFRVSGDRDIKNIIHHTGVDLNDTGEISFTWRPNGDLRPSGVRYMRRIRNGDVNFDGVVDVDDFLAMPGCFTGSVDTDRLCQCRFYDMDHDRDVDLDDLDLFLRVYTGSGPDPTNDCDSNGTSDFAELLVGTASDCNLNAIPDGCETSDLDGDGMLDSCCLPTTPILSSTGVRNRYLTFKTINQAPFKLSGMGVRGEPVAMHNVNQAIRVTITAAPANPPAGFEALVGKSFWVSSPKTVCENSGQNFNTPIEECAPAAGLLSNTFLMASLQCDPVFAPWFELGEVHVQHQMIIPGATYAIELINEGCSLATASNFSAALTVTNSRWGDVVANCSTSPCGPPDGVVNITTDVTAVLEKFKNAPSAPSKSRSDIEPSTPDGKINFTDVTFTLDAFTQQPYPFTPTPLICPG